MSEKPGQDVEIFRSPEKKAKRVRGTPNGQTIKPHPEEKKKRIPIRVPLSKDHIEGQLSPGTPARLPAPERS